MKKIVMEYPSSYNNDKPLFDGQSHTIKPTNLFTFYIGNRQFFILSYSDLDYEMECVTLLTVINRNLVKVPLNNYDLLERLISILQLKPVSLDLLPSKIGLAQTMETESLIAVAQAMQQKDPNITINDIENIPEYTFDRYIPYNQLSNPTNVDKRIFGSSGVIYHERNQEYVFDKQADCPAINRIIQRKLVENKDKIHEGKTFKFTVRVKIPEGTVAYIPTKDKKRVQMVQLIPGIHKYKILVAPCINKQKNQQAIDCLSCSVDAPKKEYRDLHDIDIAFRDGYKDKLDMIFDGTFFEKRKLR